MDTIDESDFEEHEEYTAIYRKSRRKHRRRKHPAPNTSSEGTLKTKTLSPFIVGAKPQTDKLHKNDINRLVHDTLGEIGISSPHFQTEIILEEKRNRVFLGECAYDEDLTILQTTRIWKCRKTGKNSLDTFRRVVEFITFAQKMFNCDRTPKLSQQETILFFLDTQTLEKQDKDSPKLLFDMTPFKSIGQRSFVNSVKGVLQKDPIKRAEKDVSALLHVLRNFSKFSSYPQHIQQGICRKGWYSKFDSNHVIAREGNKAEFYYMIISGVAVSRCLGTTIDPQERRKQLAEFHRQGDIIGEKEILTNSGRSATYVSKEPLEVLGLDRDIFLDIFKSAGGAECISFLRRGAVIVKNSNDAEWVYVIRSGSCQAFKAVRSNDNQDVQKITEKRKHSSLLPSLRSNSIDSLKSKSSEGNKSPNRAKTLKKPSKTQLPTINKAKNSLVSQSYDENINTIKETPKKSVKKTKQETQTSIDNPVHYAKIDLVTERECFGLQSLLFDDMPSLSLVSNGAECVLISKQFLKEHMDTETKRRLQSKIAPYPNLVQIRNAVDDKLAWKSYRDQVLYDTVR
ncbi:unnamed protein product [Mytilus edulis]|uniref:Cyclic nucleotide-binding domain-containing protein n=1 Tax=Mytilus edulis TaxID=6550 RepID=A0A8S3VKS8_MYTED|nr:unnamed protein product [Mytilus edulis]